MEAQGGAQHTCTIFSHTHNFFFTLSHVLVALQPNAHTLLLRLAEVVAEVVVARRFGDGRRALGDGNVLQVQEAELNLHREQDLQLAAH